MIKSRSTVPEMSNVSYKLCIENKNTYFMFNTIFFDNHTVHEIMCEKYCRGGEATDENLVHAHCMLDT